jgi:hypothetical protein
MTMKRAPCPYNSPRLRLDSFLSGGVRLDRAGTIILSPMASVVQIASSDAIRRIQRVQTLTIIWMSVEALVSLLAAWRARSPALLGLASKTSGADLLP